MGAARFFVESLEPGLVTLNEVESRHAGSARRLSAGDSVMLFNGQGDEAAGSIVTAGGARKAVEVSIAHVVHRPRPIPRLTLAVAMPKGPRQEWLIEKCAELGVCAIQPLITQRSVSETSPHRRSRWRQICIEAAKQSAQAWLPELKAPLRIESLLEGPEDFPEIYIAVIGAAHFPGNGRPGSLLVLVGPEGGWTDQELATITRAGAKPVGLGPHVLRVETAALAVAALVHAQMRSV